jgi:hypothetical protein
MQKKQSVFSKRILKRQVAKTKGTTSGIAKGIHLAPVNKILAKRGRSYKRLDYVTWCIKHNGIDRPKK